MDLALAFNVDLNDPAEQAALADFLADATDRELEIALDLFEDDAPSYSDELPF